MTAPVAIIKDVPSAILSLNWATGITQIR
eukprot:SAG25_NODE_5759_length_623_cov_1.568702_2_plen_28_part_01